MDNIVLCGFMGCGKTTVGRQLAEMTGFRFVDMDAYIEEQAGMTVSAIFEQFGEVDFRKREREACATLCRQNRLVIATGGGALTFPENAAMLRSTGCIVLIAVSPEAVLQRLKDDNTRPLLARTDKKAAVRELHDRRIPLYRAAADIEVDGEQAPEQVAQAIRDAVKTFRRNPG